MKHYPINEYHAYDTIVLANGAFPTHPSALAHIDRWINQPEQIMLACCDGAVNNLQGYTNLLPNIVVGDLDSVQPSLRERLGERVIHISEQETNDLTKTMHHVTQEIGKKRIVLLGITGKRDDHMLGNLVVLPHYAPWVDELVIVTDSGYFRLIKEDASLEVEVGQGISIFSFEPKPISLIGLHWPLTDYVLPYLWSGTLNRADEKIITIKTKHPILVFVANK